MVENYIKHCQSTRKLKYGIDSENLGNYLTNGIIHANNENDDVIDR